MKLLTAPYLAQVQSWPQSGRHILAQFDTDSIIVYLLIEQKKLW